MDFLNNENFQKLKRKIIRFLVDQKLYISSLVELSKSITAFATNRSWLSFAEGGFGILETITKTVSWSSDDFFNQNQGWQICVSYYGEQVLYDILIPVLETYENKTLTFQYSETESSKIYYTPIGMVGRNGRGLWRYIDDNNQNSLLEFLMKKLFELIGSNFLSLTEEEQSSAKYWGTNSKFFLKGEKLTSIPSAKSKKYIEHIKSANEQGIHRAIMLLGMPGVGKTIIANTIVSELEFRTLKFKYDTTTNLRAIEFIIDTLNIDAIIMDDLDQTENATKLLDFLEKVHSKVKLNIATVNSLKPFHSALLRPFRFDEIITIDKIEASVIKEILGDRYKQLNEKVSKWPVSYILELNNRLKINPKLNISANIRELDKRVKAAQKSLKNGD